jgi:hypothetical protein
MFVFAKADPRHGPAASFENFDPSAPGQVVIDERLQLLD